MAESKPHISQNRLQGSLADAPVQRLLEACHKHLVTARIEVKAGGKNGIIEVRAGAVEDATFGDQKGTAAVGAMSELSAGDYELRQQLPDLNGNLGDSASFEGRTKDMKLVKVLRHCEDNALSCIITVKRGSDVAVIHYRVGEIEKVLFNGEKNEDALFELTDVDDATFQVTAPPLDLDIDGWPSMDKEPTGPFKIVRGASEGDIKVTKLEEEPAPKKAAEPAAKKPEPVPQKQPEAAAQAETRSSNQADAATGKRRRAGTGSSALPPMSQRFVRPSAPPGLVGQNQPAPKKSSTVMVVAILCVLGALWALILFRVLGN